MFWRFFYFTWMPPTWTSSFDCTSSTWWRKCIPPTIIQIDGIVLQHKHVGGNRIHCCRFHFHDTSLVNLHYRSWINHLCHVKATFCVMWKLYIVGCVFVSMTWVEYLTNVWENRAEWSRKIFFSEVPVMHGSHICCVHFFALHKWAKWTLPENRVQCNCFSSQRLASW